MRLLAFFFLLLAASIADASPRQPLDAIERAVDTHLRRETRGMPGEVSYTIDALDRRLSLPACSSLETFTARGARLWGRSSVGVRCAAGARWTLYVAVTIQVRADYAVAARPLAQGQVVQAADLVMQSGELGELPAGVITDAAQALGKRLASPLGAGQPLRQDLLRAPLLIQQGQTVRLVARGGGFQASAQGQAVGNAHEGQLVQVRTAGGQTVSGIARPGPVVEVAPGG